MEAGLNGSNSEAIFSSTKPLAWNKASGLEIRFFEFDLSIHTVISTQEKSLSIRLKAIYPASK
jgi:hypothetical protein